MSLRDVLVEVVELAVILPLPVRFPYLPLASAKARRDENIAKFTGSAEPGPYISSVAKFVAYSTLLDAVAVVVKAEILQPLIVEVLVVQV